MAQVIGKVSEVSGLFYAKDTIESSRVLKVGDELFIDEMIVGDNANSVDDSLKFSVDGKDFSVLAYDQLLLDDTLVEAKIEDFENLEAPAAGDAEVDALEGRFSDRTAQETDITTDLRDASFNDERVTVEEDVLAEVIAPLEPVVVLDDIPVPVIEDSRIELSAQNVEVDEDAIGNNTNPDTDGVINQSSDTGTITLLGATAIVFANDQTTTLTAGGERIILITSDDGQIIIGSVEGNEIFRATLASDGLSYTFELKDAVDHQDAVSEDIVTLNLDIVANNGTTSKTITIDVAIADDVPTITNPLNSILTNEIGNMISGVDLNIESGADNPIGIVLKPEVNRDGFAIDTNDNLLTSTVGDDSYNLVYLPTVGGTAGSVTAYQYIDATTTGDAIFTLTPDMSGAEYTGTYTILIGGKLDGVAYTVENIIDKANLPEGGGIGPVVTFSLPITDSDDSEYLHIIATDNNNLEDVNYNNIDMGIANSTIAVGEELKLTFENSESQTLDLQTATFGLTAISTSDTAVWTAYNNGDPVGTGSVTGTVKNEGTNAVAQVEVTSDDITGDQFDSVVFTASGGEYSIASMDATISSEVAGVPHSINVAVDVTDSDLDIASGDIEITFDEDGVIEYESDSIIDGGVQNDTLIVDGSSELDFSTLSNAVVTDIENVDLRGDTDTTVQNVTIQSVFDVTDDTNVLNILGDSADRVLSNDSGWTQTGIDTIDGVTYNQYQGTYHDGSLDQTVVLNIQDTVVEEIV
ncbi:MAG: hypothetical protein U9R16_06575 [Campylobacterota bacterium]|nr:hypothetical protein [Campylobacterota bacterium]